MLEGRVAHLDINMASVVMFSSLLVKYIPYFSSFVGVSRIIYGSSGFIIFGFFNRSTLSMYITVN